jgi:hypothetical protein
MKDRDRFRLLGPYRTPRFRDGRTVRCAVRGEVEDVGVNEAPIAWSVGKKGRAKWLVVFKDLARAVRRESEIAVAYPWGVTGQTVGKWRKALGVGSGRGHLVAAERPRRRAGGRRGVEEGAGEIRRPGAAGQAGGSHPRQEDGPARRRGPGRAAARHPPQARVAAKGEPDAPPAGRPGAGHGGVDAEGGRLGEVTAGGGGGAADRPGAGGGLAPAQGAGPAGRA